MFNPHESAMSRPFVVVVGVDLRDQDSSGYAFDQAVRIASRVGGSEAHVVYVVDDRKDENVSELAHLLQLYISDKAAALGLRGPQRAASHIRRGDAAKGIAQLASDLGADMIVVGTRRMPQLGRAWVGSTAERIMAVTECPVFVAGPKPKPQPSHVITIEPPCPQCVTARFSTRGGTWWCDRHAQPHHLNRHHVYSYTSEYPFAAHDSAVTSTGTD